MGPHTAAMGALAAAACATILRADDVLSQPYASVASPSLLPRQDTAGGATAAAPNASAGVPVNADGTLDLAAWNSAVDAACVSTLRAIPQSTNPSGNCVCYNLPALDSASGAFEADLRLYKISDPRDGFAGVRPQDVNVSVAYAGASVSSIGQEAADGSAASRRREVDARADGDPELLKVFMLVGQIDDSELSGDMSMARLEALVMPTLTLTAQSSTGSTPSTNASLNEAAFLTGVFSSQVVMSDFSAAQAAVDAQVAKVDDGTVPFVLPGVQIMIFPVGLVITGVWLLVGVAAYGFGTVERIRYAESYRRRLAAAGARGWKTM